MLQLPIGVFPGISDTAKTPLKAQETELQASYDAQILRTGSDREEDIWPVRGGDRTYTRVGTDHINADDMVERLSMLEWISCVVILVGILLASLRGQDTGPPRHGLRRFAARGSHRADVGRRCLTH